jgi:homopolymeric O-antigen transport system permease protein
MTTLDQSAPTGRVARWEMPSGRHSIRVVTAADGVPGLRRGLAELWRYRQLVISMALRELRVRYRQSTLGPLWALLQPLALMVLFSLFLGRFARMPNHGIPYPIFYYAALMPWSFAASSLAVSANCLLVNAALINKVYFPREVFPLVGMLVAAADFGFASIGMAGMMVCFHTPLTAYLLYLPLLFAGQFLFCLAFGLVLASVSVYLRDIRHALPFLTQVWMYASPVLYSLESVPHRFVLPYLLLNPLAVYMDGYRRVILYGQAPQLPFLALAFALSLGALALAYRLFKILERRCADTL